MFKYVYLFIKICLNNPLAQQIKFIVKSNNYKKYFQNPLMIKILAAVYNTFGLQKNMTLYNRKL